MSWDYAFVLVFLVGAPAVIGLQRFADVWGRGRFGATRDEAKRAAVWAAVGAAVFLTIPLAGARALREFGETDAWILVYYALIGAFYLGRLWERRSRD